MSRRALRVRREVLISVAVVVVFVVALLLWAGRDPGSGSTPGALPTGAGTASGTASVPGSASPSASGSVSASASSTGHADLGGLPLTPLPADASDVNGGSLAVRRVHLEVDSDATILRMGYVLRGGDPDKYVKQVVAPPATFDVVAHGYGLVAEIAAQAGPTATTISCTVRVDGGTPVTHTTKGAYGVVVCFG